MTRTHARIFTLIAAVSLVSMGALAATADWQLPADWRSWQHVKGMVILDKQNGLYGFHHVYVQPKAMAAYRAGKGYPEGSMLAVPFHDVQQADGVITEGKLLKVAIMKKDRAAKDTGGWVFGAVDADGKRLELDGKTACFTCHQPKQDRDFVFSQWPDEATR